MINNNHSNNATFGFKNFAVRIFVAKLGDFIIKFVACMVEEIAFNISAANAEIPENFNLNLLSKD